MKSTTPQIFHHSDTFQLQTGDQIEGFQIAFETWGRLNEQGDNAILVCPGLSASSHARSHELDDPPGWWEAMIGPGAALDTNRFFVICTNHFGGCFGSTGPSSIDPKTAQPYGPTFPKLLIDDIAAANQCLLEELGVQQLACVIGASMGGMLALAHAALFPNNVRNMITISASAKPTPQSIAYRYVQRQVILCDPNYHDGWYYDKHSYPHDSMAVARQIGNITYRSAEEVNERFKDQRTQGNFDFGPDFEVESYLHHMGHKLASHFDANSFLYLTKAMDLFDIGKDAPSFEAGIGRIKARTLVIGVSHDLLFPFSEQERIHQALQSQEIESRLVRLESIAGHDAFLVELEFFRDKISQFLDE